MEKPNFDKSIQILDDECYNTKGNIIVWRVLAVLMFIVVVLNIVIGKYFEVIPFVAVDLSCLYVILLHKRHLTDIDLLKTCITTLDKTADMQKEFVDKVEEAVNKATAEAEFGKTCGRGDSCGGAERVS